MKERKKYCVEEEKVAKVGTKKTEKTIQTFSLEAHLLSSCDFDTLNVRAV